MTNIPVPVAGATDGNSSSGDHVDVLIIGAGPMGLMTALWLTGFGLKVRIIDERGTRALNGRADGFHVRSLEIWDSFGLGHIFANHGTPFAQWALWAPNGDGGLARQKQEAAIGTDVSRFTCGTMHQGNIEAALIEAIRRRSDIRVERGVVPTRIEVDDSRLGDHGAHVATVDLRRAHRHELASWAVNAHSVRDGVVTAERGHIEATVVPGNDGSDTVPAISGEPGSTERVHARYVVGADGGHSWVRRQMGIRMEGASHEAQWGVVDAVLITDFPDVKKHFTILSPAGTVLGVPREEGLTRLYIQLPPGDQAAAGQAAAEQTTTAQGIMASAARIFAPSYRLSYSYCDWWAVYKVGQRVAERFQHGQRVLLGGDAVHTHTPKGGQGMNVSMQDAYNLGWKLGGVASGRLSPAVLPTYEGERRPIAQLLIDIDTVLAGSLSDTKRTTTLDVDAAYAKLRDFNSGANICYPPSLLVARPPSPSSSPPLTTSLVPGLRMPPHRILNLASGLPADLQGLFPSDGHWRLLVLGGDVGPGDGDGGAQLARVNALGAAIASRRALRDRARPLLLVRNRCEQVEMADFHDVFFPLDPRRGHDYGRIYADTGDDDGSGSAHAAFGVSVAAGCMVLVRPDQCISWVGALDEVRGLQDFLGRVFVSD